MKEAFEEVKGWDSVMYAFPVMFSILAFLSLSSISLVLGIVLSIPMGFLVTLLVVMLKQHLK